MIPALHCPKCAKPQPSGIYNIDGLHACPNCGALLHVAAYPVLFQGPDRPQETHAVQEDQAGCFYHPGKQAVIPCDHCGRFLCALCDIEIDGKHLCPACLESGRASGRLNNLEKERTLYDSMALKLALYPLIIFWFTIITAPIALYLGIRHWNKPLSIIRRSRIRLVLAIIISSLEILAWLGALLYL